MGPFGRILVVEDEGLVAMALEELLKASGYEVVGPAPSTRKALKLIESEVIDAGVLDINLGDERVDSVALALARSHIPFLFCTGYSNKTALPPAFSDRRVLTKPYRGPELLGSIASLLTPRS